MTNLWCCPACRFSGRTAEAFVGHLFLVHVRPVIEEATPIPWTCPAEECEAKRFVSAQDLAIHLEKHALTETARSPRKRGAPKKPPQRCFIRGCTVRAIARRRCLRHYRMAMKRIESRGKAR